LTRSASRPACLWASQRRFANNAAPKNKPPKGEEAAKPSVSAPPKQASQPKKALQEVELNGMQIPGKTGILATRIFVVSVQLGKIDALISELNMLSQFQDMREFNRILEDPTMKPEEKKDFFSELAKRLKLSIITLGALETMVNEKQEKHLWTIVKNLNSLLKAHRKEHSAVVYTKKALTPQELAQYKEMIKMQYLSHDVILKLENKVDSAIVDGYKVVVDETTTIDRTLNTEINEIVMVIKEEMKTFWEQRKRGYVNIN